MQKSIEYSVADSQDKDGVIKLVEDCKLPYEDINEEKLKSFIVAKADNSII